MVRNVAFTTIVKLISPSSWLGILLINFGKIGYVCTVKTTIEITNIVEIIISKVVISIAVATEVQDHLYKKVCGKKYFLLSV